MAAAAFGLVRSDVRSGGFGRSGGTFMPCAADDRWRPEAARRVCCSTTQSLMARHGMTLDCDERGGAAAEIPVMRPTGRCAIGHVPNGTGQGNLWSPRAGRDGGMRTFWNSRVRPKLFRFAGGDPERSVLVRHRRNQPLPLSHRISGSSCVGTRHWVSR